jgi:hypothetical protein
MSNDIPVEVYEAIAELNHKGLDEAIERKDFNRMHQCFNRMTHALEQVEQYKMNQARRHIL